MDAETLTSLTGTAATAAVLNGDMSAEQLVSTFIDQIEQENPKINAVRSLLRDHALEQARAVDQKRAAGQTCGPLAGLPVLIKENCDVAGATCSAGLNFRRSRVASRDSAVVHSLREADAIILGVSISDPGAFDTRTAEVVHPIDAALTVGGSSGGSAAGLAASMCLGAIGTDTGGSIRIPSACCGTAGLKPTYDALPLAGVFPLVPSLDHVGPMARNVGDVAMMWGALWGAENVAQPLPKRIGYDPAYLDECDPVIRSALCEALETCRAKGVVCIELALPDLNAVLEMHSTIFTIEAHRYHTTHHHADLGKYPELARAWFKVADSIIPEKYERAIALRAEITAQIDALFRDVGIILAPTMACLVPEKTAQAIVINGQTLPFTMGMVRHTCLLDHTGHPALSAPLHASGGVIPASVQLIGPKHGETAIMSFAQQVLDA